MRNSIVGTGFGEPYQVMYRSGGWTGDWMYATPQDATAISLNGRPLVPTGYVDFVKNVDRLRDIRSGDIILMANYTPERTLMEPEPTGNDVWTAGGYYFGGVLPGWHGSLYDTDMLIPIIFSNPTGEGPALSAFLDTVNQKIPGIAGDPPRIVDITPTQYKLLTGEDY